MMDEKIAGFTLLEILVALVVMGFLLAGLSQGTRFGLRAWDLQARMIDQHGELDAVDRTLRRLIQQADPGTAAGGATLAGTARRLALTSALPMEAPAVQRADMVLAVDAAHRLMLGWMPHLHVILTGPPPPPKDAELLRGVSRLEIGYWRTDGAGGWRDRWAERDLPALVRLRIVFEPGDARAWPDIVAAPMLRRQRG